METDFIQDYKTALQIKEIGFDEPCLARFRRKMFQMNMLGKGIKYNSQPVVDKVDISAPTFNQVLRWLETKGIHCNIINESYIDDDKPFVYNINYIYEGVWVKKHFNDTPSTKFEYAFYKLIKSVVPIYNLLFPPEEDEKG